VANYAAVMFELTLKVVDGLTEENSPKSQKIKK